LNEGIAKTVDTALLDWKAAGHWSDEEENKIIALGDEIANKRAALKKGSGMTIDDARQLCINILDLTAQQNALGVVRWQLLQDTAPYRAAHVASRFCMLKLAVFAETNQPVLKSLDDFYDQNNPYIGAISRAYSILMNTVPDDLKEVTPEVAFLQYMKFMDEDGNFINAQGEKTDRFGNLLPEKKDEPAVFLDAEGKPITINFDEITKKGRTPVPEETVPEVAAE
jgi:hypothetical protein